MTRLTQLPRGMKFCPVCNDRAIDAGTQACRLCVATMPKAKRDELVAKGQPIHKFVVQGTPVPKGRPRTVRTDDGSMRTFTPKRTKDYEKLVQEHAALSRLPNPLHGPVTMHLLFVTKLNPDGTCKADIDNMSKAIMDALNGICYADDKQVRRLVVEVIDQKRAPRTEIVVEEYKP